MTFEDLVHVFNSNHLYPVWLEVDSKGNEMGLEIRCPAIQSQSRLALVESLIPWTMKAEFMPNEETIIVSEKKK